MDNDVAEALAKQIVFMHTAFEGLGSMDDELFRIKGQGIARAILEDSNSSAVELKAKCQEYARQLEPIYQAMEYYFA